MFVEWHGNADALAAVLKSAEDGLLSLRLITNRGVKVWPGGLPETAKADHWRCRFLSEGEVTHADVLALLQGLLGTGLDFIKTEHLYTFDGAPGYSLGQGQ